jgi:hypothetical protein
VAVRRVAFVFVFVACKAGDRPTEVVQLAPDAASAPPPVTEATTEAQAPDENLAARLVLKRWDDAHNAHDARALEALYAPSVRFYGATLSASECAKRKTTAFAKTPDYSQSVKGPSFAPQDDGSVLVRFLKVTTANGKHADYASFLVVTGGRVAEESDKISDENLARAQANAEEWCFAPDYSPNDLVRPPFKTSAFQAWGDVWQSRHIKDLMQRIPKLGIDAPVRCPTACGVTPDTCGLGMRVVDWAQLGHTVSIMVEWLWVDAVKNVVWFQGATGWESEQLVSHPHAWVEYVGDAWPP